MVCAVFVSFAVMVPVMVTSRSPLTLLTACGPLTSWMVTSDPSGTIPEAVGTGKTARAAALSATPGGSWTRTFIVPCGRLTWAATWPFKSCAIRAAS